VGELEQATPAPTPAPACKPNRLPRLKRDVPLFSTRIDIPKEDTRGELYGWNIGDESSGVYGGDEVFAKGAIWSPSGLSDIGGSIMAIMSSTGQISVYAPGADAAEKPWVEVSSFTTVKRYVAHYGRLQI
jgi:general transcription factor 3C protein 4